MTRVQDDVLGSTRIGQALRLELHRPDRANALSPGLVEGLRASLENDAPVLAVVAAGRHFCSGFDLGDVDALTEDETAARLVRVELMLQALNAHAGFTLAYAQGRAWGAGADIFITCDERWADADATFRFPGPLFGLVLGTRRLAARIGAGRAAALVMSQRGIDAREALALGIVDRIGSRAEFDERLTVAATSPSLPDADTRRHLRARLQQADGADDSDLAALVRSAFRPGLKARIAEYRSTFNRAASGAGQ